MIPRGSAGLKKKYPRTIPGLFTFDPPRNQTPGHHFTSTRGTQHILSRKEPFKSVGLLLCPGARTGNTTISDRVAAFQVFQLSSKARHPYTRTCITGYSITLLSSFTRRVGSVKRTIPFQLETYRFLLLQFLSDLYSSVLTDVTHIYAHIYLRTYYAGIDVHYCYSCNSNCKAAVETSLQSGGS